jgi:hypothetical protein
MQTIVGFVQRNPWFVSLLIAAVVFWKNTGTPYILQQRERCKRSFASASSHETTEADYVWRPGIYTYYRHRRRSRLIDFRFAKLCLASRDFLRAARFRRNFFCSSAPQIYLVVEGERSPRFVVVLSGYWNFPALTQ